MVMSLPMHEVTQAQLDEEIENLANVAFSDKSDLVQQSMWSLYVRLATSCLDHILETNQKIIVQGTNLEFEKDQGDNQHEDIDEFANLCEDVDEFANLCPLQ